MNNQCGAETQGRLHFSVALHEKSESPPGPSAPSAVDSDLDFQEKCRDCWYMLYSLRANLTSSWYMLYSLRANLTRKAAALIIEPDSEIRVQRMDDMSLQVALLKRPA